VSSLNTRGGLNLNSYLNHSDMTVIFHLSPKPPNVFIILIHVRYMPSETVTHTFLYFSNFNKLFSCFFIILKIEPLCFSQSNCICKPLLYYMLSFFLSFILFSFCHTMMLCPITSLFLRNLYTQETVP